MDTQHSQRPIALIESGRKIGPITRLVSPDTLGHRLKPFVFFDFVEAEVPPGFGFGFHPHSGIATLTHHRAGDVEYEDTSGQSGKLRAQGMEWMQAGSGVWHKARIADGGAICAFQLWVALAPPEEEAPARGLYIPPEAIPVVGGTTVLLGRHGAAQSAVATPRPIDVFHVSLEKGASWTYVPPPGVDVAWLFPYQDALLVGAAEPVTRQLVVWDEGTDPITVTACGASAFLFGAAAKHPYDLYIGNHSVHTSARALQAGEARIEALGRALGARGR